MAGSVVEILGVFIATFWVFSSVSSFARGLPVAVSDS